MYIKITMVNLVGGVWFMKATVGNYDCHGFKLFLK